MSNHEAVSALVRDLQGMRWGIEEYRSGPRSTEPETAELVLTLLDRYDEALVRIVVLLGVEVSITPNVLEADHRLNDEVRSLLEQAVRDRGLELDPPGH